MGDNGRSLTNDPEMLRKTVLALSGESEGIDLIQPRSIDDIESPHHSFASDKDPRTQHFSQCFSHLSHSLFRVDQILILNERAVVEDNLEKMASNFEATEDENKRNIFNVKLPPKLMG